MPELTGDDFAFVYRERARLVAHLAAIYPSVVAVDAAEPDWPVVYVGTVQGQMSWHISRDDLDLFPHVRQVPAADMWDGHSTQQKYERLAALTALRAQVRDCDAAAVKADLRELEADIAAASRPLSLEAALSLVYPEWDQAELEASAAKIRAENTQAA